MKTLIVTFLAFALAGCATETVTHSRAWEPTTSEIREVFEAIENPYRTDDLAAHAYAEGFLRAYAVGPAAVGTLLVIPREFGDQITQEGFRSGWNDGGLLAARDYFNLANLKGKSQMHPVCENSEAKKCSLIYRTH